MGAEGENPMWQSFKKVPTVETRIAVSNYVKDTLDKYGDLPLDVGGIKPIKRVEKNWWCYLRWLNDLQNFFMKKM